MFGETQADKGIIKSDIFEGKVHLLYITRENVIENPKYRNMLLLEVYTENLVAVVVDKAHLVKMWVFSFAELSL